MSDITATVSTTELVTATIDSGSGATVSAVGIQGVSSNDAGLAGLTDVDALSPDNGSVLVFKSITSKWTATTTLDAQNMEGGEF